MPDRGLQHHVEVSIRCWGPRIVRQQQPWSARKILLNSCHLITNIPDGLAQKANEIRGRNLTGACKENVPGGRLARL